MEIFSKDKLKKMLKGAKKIAIIGAGNILRGDDAVGVLIAYRLKRLAPRKALVLIGEVYPESYLDVIAKDNEITYVVYIDAVDAGERLGTAMFVDIDEIPQGLFDTHKLPLKFFWSYLKKIGKKLIIIGIQVKNIKIGSSISRELFDKAMRIADEIYRVLEEL